MSVAVILVNYHVHDELDRALSSIARFLRAGDEVVVVDQEGDAARATGIQTRHPHVHVIPTKTNVGFAAGVNLGGRASAAEHLLLLNPDTVMGEPVLDRLEAYLREHPEVGIVGPRVLNEDGSVQPSARRFPGLSTLFAGRSTWLTRTFPANWLSEWNLPARTADGPVAVDWLAGSCFMTRRDVFETLGGFDEAFFLYWEDADFCRRAADRGWACVYLPTASVCHAGGRSAAANLGPAIRAFHASAFRFYLKHARPAARLVAPVARLGLWMRGEWFVWRAAATARRRSV